MNGNRQNKYEMYINEDTLITLTVNPLEVYSRLKVESRSNDEFSHEVEITTFELVGLVEVLTYAINDQNTISIEEELGKDKT